MFIKELETAILNKLKKAGGESDKIKYLAVPTIDFNGIRQNIIVNLQYIKETFVSPNEKKAIFAPLPTKKRISNIEYSLFIYYKDLRNQYNDVYDLFDILANNLHGELLQINEIDGLISPLFITSIEFIERNSQSFLVYKCNLDLKICV